MRKPNRNCSRCSSPTELRRVEHPYWNGSTLVALVKDVPSWVCVRCGYHHFDSAVETTLRFIVRDYERMGTLFPVPVTVYREEPN